MSAEADVLRYERQVNQALRQMQHRTNYEPATVDTPLDALLASESGDLDEWGVRNETIRGFFEYILADGPHPAQILRRIFAIGAHMMIEPFCLLSLRERAMMMNESHGAQHWRVRRICTDPLMRKEARSIKAPGQKSAFAAAVAAEVQQGNTNRRNGRSAREGGKRRESTRGQHRKTHQE